ncbi:hypothetical protein BDV59DRAFT_200744 [Aspergillus ambiguus]|uniref:Zn(II)2Cys6 transcription factor n=1 Tax=Aspergillus ambiguus TaxID=176160 RepID=UPI003CCD4B06
MTPKQTRSSSSRVRTGCLTCKARRVKCDETKPVCKKCQSAKRECAGYLSAKDAATRVVPAKFTVYMPGIERPKNVFFPQFSGDQERISFEYFFLRTAHSFEAEFSTFLLSLVRDDPAISHALMAVGAFHRAFECGSIRDPSFQSRIQIFAFQRYGHAIQSLVRPAQAPENASFLAASVLFATFEALLGNYKLASLHLRSGIKLVQEMLNGRAFPSSSEAVLKMLQPLDSLCMLRGQRPLPMYGPCPEIPEKFQSLKEARKSFHDHLALPSRLHILKEHLNLGGLGGDVHARLTLREETMRALVHWEQWASSFGKYEADRGQEYLNLSTEAFALRTCFVIAKIYLSFIDCPLKQDGSPQISLQDGRLPEVYWLHELCLKQSVCETSPVVAFREEGVAVTFQVGAMVGIFISAFYCAEPIFEHIINHLYSVGMWNSEISMGVMQRMTNIRI